MEPFVLQRSTLPFRGEEPNFQEQLQTFEVAVSKFHHLRLAWTVKVSVIDCFQSCSFPSLSIKEGFGFGFGPFVGILMKFKGNGQDETDPWCRPNFLEVDFYNWFKQFEISRQNFKELFFTNKVIHLFKEFVDVSFFLNGWVDRNFDKFFF